MNTYKITTQIDRDKWSEFVSRHPDGNIFQSPELFDVFAHTHGYRPIAAAAVDDKGNIAGIVSAVIQEHSPGIFRRLSTRAVAWGGPLINVNGKGNYTREHDAVLQTLLDHYDRLAGTSAIYSEYRNFRDQQNEKKLFQHSGYQYEDHLNILVDLTKSEEQLWKEIDHRRRNCIRRAQKEGTLFKDLTPHIDVTEIDQIYNILDNVYRKAKIPLAHISLFQYAADILGKKDMIRFFGALNNGKIIGTLVALCYKDTIYDWYAGSSREYYHKYPNDLLPWNVFLWGKEKGYKIFDFGGAGKPGKPSGVRDYKKKFGGTFVDFGRYSKVHKPLLMKVAETGFHAWQKVKFKEGR